LEIIGIPSCSSFWVPSSWRSTASAGYWTYSSIEACSPSNQYDPASPCCHERI
jgi:hypothetical protein